VWPGLKRFVMVKKECESMITGEKSEETRYYITSVKDINLIADGIRGHWQILSEDFCYPKLLPGIPEKPDVPSQKLRINYCLLLFISPISAASSSSSMGQEACSSGSADVPFSIAVRSCSREGLA